MPEHPCPAPAVGQHTIEIMKEMLGKSDEWIEQAIKGGAF